MEPEAFNYALNTAYEYIYNNESELEPLQYPLAMSRFKVPRFANDLYTDGTNQYFTYSGTANSLIVTKEKDGRYKNLTLRAYSGDSFKFYFQAGSGISDSDLYFSGPLTTSGVYSTMTQYATQSGALTNAITFSAPTNNSSVYTLPSVQNLNWIRLFHQSTDGTTPYRIYQFLPRTLIQVDDLEADVIDVVTLRVSGSIVVSADDLAPGSITGDKIMAGTVSGVLITPGGITATQIAARTITANQIAVSGITAETLNVSQLDAVAANMGNLVVNSGISIGTNGTIWAGSGPVATPTTGLKIYTTGGVSRLTTYNASTPQVDIDSNGKLTAGEGNVVLDSTGISIGTITTANTASEALRILGSGGAGNIVGMAFYNGSFSPTNPQITIQADSTNALEIENNAVNGITNFNFPASGVDNSAAVNIYNANLELKRTPIPFEDNITPGALIGFDSDGTIRYRVSHEGLILNNNTDNTVTANASTGDLTILGGLYSNTVNTEYGARVKGELDAAVDGSGLVYKFNVNTNGDINTTGGIFAGTSNNKFTVQSATGNTAIAGTLGVTGTTTLNGNFLQYNYGGMYKNTVQTIVAGADARITFNVTYVNGTLDNLASNRLTIANAGLYIITAGVISATVGSTWTVVTGGAFNSGTVLANVIQVDMRAYTTKPVYLGSGTNLELWVRNSGGTTISLNAGTNGTILTASKVG
jgi:hypothetical protein